MNRQRENNLDLLRIICTIAIIALHIGSGYADEYTADEPEYYFIVGNVFHTMTRFAVPCFIMLSGAFLLNNARNRDAAYFYRKSWQQLGIPLLAVSILYVGYTYSVYAFQFFYQGTSVDWLKPLRQWAAGNPFFHLWYMYMLAGLYLLVPVIIRIKVRLSPIQYVGAAGVIMIVNVLANNIYMPSIAWGVMSLYYLGYLLWGDILHRSGWHSPWVWAGGLAGLAAILYIKQVQVLDNPSYMNWLGNVLDPLNILAVLAGMCIFKGFCQWQCFWQVSRLAGHTYNIYLIHALWLHVLWSILKLTGHKDNPLYIIPALIMIVTPLSYISSVLYEKYIAYK